MLYNAAAYDDGEDDDDDDDDDVDGGDYDAGDGIVGPERKPVMLMTGLFISTLTSAAPSAIQVQN